ncbi:MAG: hypothetical protein HY290_32290 [Planctomycetia bacterium]|nr:hypothetical protein [Planctomycetia bacterium]
MGARFAGSQRVGDRRRRRLAVEAEEGVDQTVTRRELTSPSGASRFVDRPHAENGDAGPALAEFPLVRLIPVESWKYFVGGLGGFAICAAAVIAGRLAPSIVGAAGTSLERALRPEGATTKWLSGLMLGLSAQLSMVIWWARSRSLKDFDGRYWFWAHAAVIWIAFSGCLAIDATQVAIDLLQQLRPGTSGGWAAQAWAIPASMIGAWMARGLFRETSGCRASRTLLLAALASYVASAAYDLGFLSSTGPAARILFVHTGLLAGHAVLLLGLWVHARHVIHCSSEPAQSRKAAWRIPRPHFRLSKLPAWKGLQRREVAAPTEQAPAATKSRRKSEEVRETPSASSEAAQARDSAPAVKAATGDSKPRFRLDAGHGQPAPAERADEAMESTAESEPDDDDDSSRPDLRGMSKKQRRRIMQELRERDRAARGE